MKAIKVIDLLNKIANGKTPKHIIYNFYTYEYHREQNDYFNKNIGYLFDKYNVSGILHDTVAIIEDTLKEDNKIVKLGAFDIKKFYEDYPETATFILEMFKKQEEIIDKVNGKDNE